MGTLVDSNVLIASRNDKDALFARAIEALEAAAKPLVLHEYVVLETATVLMVRAGKAMADDFVRFVLKNADFSLLLSSETEFLSAADTFMKTRSKLSFADSALLSLSSQYPVLTFDKA
jgi:predicted nucleic acid-binding protein